MSVNQIAHLGIAVHDLEGALGFYRDSLGLQHEETVDIVERGMRIAFLRAGGVLVELMEPLHEQSEISRFLEKRGAGIHHLCFEVDDIQATIERLQTEGVRMIHTEPQIGAEGLPVAFIHPRSAHGVLVEVLEKEGGPAGA